MDVVWSRAKKFSQREFRTIRFSFRSQLWHTASGPINGLNFSYVQPQYHMWLQFQCSLDWARNFLSNVRGLQHNKFQINCLVFLCCWKCYIRDVAFIKTSPKNCLLSLMLAVCFPVKVNKRWILVLHERDLNAILTHLTVTHLSVIKSMRLPSCKQHKWRVMILMIICNHLLYAD